MKKVNSKEDLAERNVYHIQNNDYYHEKSLFMLMLDSFALISNSSF